MNIRALVKRIRKKIPENSIKIVKGIGYSMNATEVEVK
jgi:DNA-binding response OmpR family regulator